MISQIIEVPAIPMPPAIPLDVTPTTLIYWSQDAPSYDTLSKYKFKHYDDGNPIGATINSVKCYGEMSPFHCNGVIPLYPIGTGHSLVITASYENAESGKSAIVTFTFYHGRPEPGK